MDRLRILIADDQRTVRAGIRSFLESQPDIEVVGESAGGQESLEQARKLRPELVLVDIAMLGLNGIEVIRNIKKELPDTSILVLTLHDDAALFFPVLRAGASGYLRKEAAPHELLYAVHTVCQGQVFLSPAVARTLLNGMAPAIEKTDDDSYRKLSPREKEVLRMAASGQTNREIAEELFLSIRTVEKHRQAVMRKLGLARREDLTKYALRKGLIGFEK
jgi:two-component system response regulator NreC